MRKRLGVVEAAEAARGTRTGLRTRRYSFRFSEGKEGPGADIGVIAKTAFTAAPAPSRCLDGWA